MNQKKKMKKKNKILIKYNFLKCLIYLLNFGIIDNCCIDYTNTIIKIYFILI